MNMIDIAYTLLGGVFIGLAAILLLMTDGKVAGISGMVGNLFQKWTQANDWRIAFLLGLVIGGFLINMFGRPVFSPLPTRSHAALIAAGLLVGLGTQLGSGCTSGHGVCGIGRGSLRSIAATLTFMVSGALAVFLIRVLAGGHI